MIVCHCRPLSADQIREAAASLHIEEPDRVLTPARVFRRLGTRPDCGGCLPLFLRVMRSVGADVAPDGALPLIGCATLRDIGAFCPRTHQPCGDGDP